MSECIIDADYGDEGFDLEISVVVSKSDKWCCECERIIRAGEEHEWAAFYDLDDEDDPYMVYEFATCMQCLEIRNTFFRGYVYTELWHALYHSDCLASGEFTIAQLDKLSAGAVALLMERIPGMFEVREENHDDDKE
jgi:hypothetical protein